MLTHYLCKTCELSWKAYASALNHRKSHPHHQVVAVLEDGTERPYSQHGGRLPEVSIKDKETKLKESIPGAIGKEGDLKSRELILGQIRVPFEDLGYSTVTNLLIVLNEFERAKSRGFTGKVGDLCAFHIAVNAGYLKVLEEADNGRIGLRERSEGEIAQLPFGEAKGQ